MNLPSQTSYVELITGCMFAGKSTELVRRIKLFRRAGHTVLCVKPVEDDRYTTGSIATHGKTDKKYPAQAVPADNPEEIITLYEDQNPSVIAIDECNLFEETLFDVVQALNQQPIKILLAGLDTNFRGEPFSPVDKLCSIADNVKKQYSICEKCNNKATRTQRLVDGEPAHINEDTILVGGKESYEPRCKECHTVPGRDLFDICED